MPAAKLNCVKDSLPLGGVKRGCNAVAVVRLYKGTYSGVSSSSPSCKDLLGLFFLERDVAEVRLYVLDLFGLGLVARPVAVVCLYLPDGRDGDADLASQLWRYPSKTRHHK